MVVLLMLVISLLEIVMPPLFVHKASTRVSLVTALERYVYPRTKLVLQQLASKGCVIQLLDNATAFHLIVMIKMPVLQTLVLIPLDVSILLQLFAQVQLTLVLLRYLVILSQVHAELRLIHAMIKFLVLWINVFLM